MTTFGDSGPIRDAVVDALGHGPRPLAEVVRRLDEQGLLADWRDEGVPEDRLGDAVLDETIDSDEIWIGADDRVLVLAEQLTDGMVLTHRLTADELDAGAVATTPDLVILDWNARDGLVLDSHGSDPATARLERHYTEAAPGQDLSTFVGPPGWLTGFAPGDVLAFTRSGTSVRVASIPPADLTAGDAEVALLRGAVEHRLREGDGEEAAPLVLDALTADVTAWRRPVPPLGELFGDAGLERRGFAFGRAGTEWAAFGDRFRAGLNASVAQRWGLDRCCEAALAATREAVLAFDPGAPFPGEDGRDIAEHLGHGAVADALVTAEITLGAADLDLLEAFAAWVVLHQPRRAAGAHQVLGLVAERRGDPDAAEAAFARAVRVDPGYESAALELSSYELERGHLDRAITLLHQADPETDHGNLAPLETLRDQVAAPYRKAGRNDTCPCGSGRRFKTCCQREPKVPVDVAILLLRFKIEAFLRRDVRRSELVGLASAAVDAELGDTVDQLVEIITTGWFVDVAAFEGGFAEAFRAERGHRLPPAELALLDIILVTPRLLWEVLDDTGGELRLRPDTGLRTDAEPPHDEADAAAAVVVPTPLAYEPGPHRWALGRVIDVGDGEMRIVGRLLLIADEALDGLRALLAGPDRDDAHALLAWWAAIRLTPPMVDDPADE